MTAREAMDIVSESSLWQTLTLEEKVEAIAYAMESVERMVHDGIEKTEGQGDSFGEVFGA